MYIPGNILTTNQPIIPTTFNPYQWHDIKQPTKPIREFLTIFFFCLFLFDGCSFNCSPDKHLKSVNNDENNRDDDKSF